MTFLKPRERRNPDKIDAFCDHLISKYRYMPNEPVMAEEFSSFFSLNPPVMLSLLKATFDRDALINPYDFRGEIRGLYLEKDDFQPYVFYDPKEAPANYTVLHELREWMGKRLEKRGYEPVSERNCEHFAACVLMPKKSFTDSLQNYGCDIKSLSTKYASSHTACCIRIAEVLESYFLIYKKTGGRLKLSHTNFPMPNGDLPVHDKSTIMRIIRTGEKLHRILSISDEETVISIQTIGNSAIVIALHPKHKHLATTLRNRPLNDSPVKLSAIYMA